MGFAPRTAAVGPEGQGLRSSGSHLSQSLYAALDLGTNNCRLLIARRRDGYRSLAPGTTTAAIAGRGGAEPPTLEIVDAFSRIVRLGEGLAMTGRLSDAAMERTVSALAVCVRKLRRYRPRFARIVATEACRRAENGGVFLARVADELGLYLETIAPQEEALLALAGCAALLDPDVPRALMFDIGGGSTELTWLAVRPGHPPLVLGWISIPLGVVNLAEAYGDATRADSGYTHMNAVFAEKLLAFDHRYGISQAIQAGGVQMLGASGTVTTLAGIHLDLPRYDRAQVDGIRLSTDDLAAVSARIRKMGEEARLSHPCIGRARSDLVIAGCAIIDAMRVLWPIPSLRIGDRGVREGILFGLMGVPAPQLAPDQPPEPPDEK
ncbi:MAG: Ppx/GppA family phosphatase [Elstera sp.]